MKNIQTGLYKITSPSGKFYIGSTTRSFKRRWMEHRSELRHHRHKNAILQAAWDKYGEDNMIFSVILYCHPDLCEMYEQLALLHLPHSYNLSIDTESPFKGRNHSDSAKEKCRLIHLGKKKAPFSEEHKRKLGLVSKGKKRPVFSDEWRKNSSLAQIERWKNPTDAMKNKKHPSGYKNPHSVEHGKNISKAKKGKKLGSENPVARKVICIETKIIFSTIKSANDWIIENHKSTAKQSNISSCCAGRLKTAYGYHWEYIE